MFILVADLLLLSSSPIFQDLIDSVITLSSILSAIWEWPEIVQLLFLGEATTDETVWTCKLNSFVFVGFSCAGSFCTYKCW